MVADHRALVLKKCSVVKTLTREEENIDLEQRLEEICQQVEDDALVNSSRLRPSILKEHNEFRQKVLGKYSIRRPPFLQDFKVNSVAVKAILDTGCSTTSISLDVAIKCSILNFAVGRRQNHLKALGGNMQIIASVPLVPVTLNNHKLVFPCQVVQGLATEMLLGMDFIVAYFKLINTVNSEKYFDLKVTQMSQVNKAYNKVSTDLKRSSSSEHENQLSSRREIFQKHKMMAEDLLSSIARIKQNKMLRNSFDLRQSIDLVKTKSSVEIPSIEISILNRVQRAIVDTGCSNSLMSLDKAISLGLGNLVDKQLKLAQMVKGAAANVKVVGTIPLVPARIGQLQSPLIFPCMVVEESPMALLLGMDFLNAYSCQIDIAKKSMGISYYKIKLTSL